MDMGLAYPAAARPSTRPFRDSGADLVQARSRTNRPAQKGLVGVSVVEFIPDGTNSSQKRLPTSLAAL
jgi:hypothetical protein